MFFEEPSPSYFAPATFRTFDADGKVVDKKFDLQLKRLKTSEHASQDARVQELRTALNPKPYDELLSSVVLGWRVEVVEGEAKVKTVKTIPFSPATLAEMEEVFPGFTFICAVAYYASLAPAEAANHASKN